MKETSDTEHVLITRAKKGDERAFTQLVRKYEQTVWGFAYKLCRDKEKAEESFQDTFINVYRKLHQFNGSAKFSTWLYSIVANNCLMKRRKRKMEMLLESLDGMPDGEKNAIQIPLHSRDDSPVDSIMKKEMHKILDDAIQQLPDDYKAVFVLRDLEEKTAEETAKILKLSVPAVKSRLRRSRIFLRNTLHNTVNHK